MTTSQQSKRHLIVRSNGQAGVDCGMDEVPSQMCKILKVFSHTPETGTREPELIIWNPG